MACSASHRLKVFLKGSELRRFCNFTNRWKNYWNRCPSFYQRFQRMNHKNHEFSRDVPDKLGTYMHNLKLEFNHIFRHSTSQPKHSGQISSRAHYESSQQETEQGGVAMFSEERNQTRILRITLRKESTFISARTTRTRNETETDFPIGGLLRRLIPPNLRLSKVNPLFDFNT